MAEQDDSGDESNENRKSKPAKYLPDALSRLRSEDETLTEIYLTDRKIGDFGATQISSLIGTNMTVVSLLLASNEIKCDGAVALAGALKNNGTVEELSLACNDISSKGMRELAVMVKENHTIEKLNLFANKLRFDVAEVMYQSLCANDTLTHLNLGYNEISDEQEDRFKKTMAIPIKQRQRLWGVSREGVQSMLEKVELKRVPLAPAEPVAFIFR